MRAHTLKPLRVALAAALLLGAASAHSQLFRWIDDHGSVTFSNEPPSDPAAVRDLTVVDETVRPMTLHERRTLEILNAQRETPGNTGAAQDALAAPSEMPDPLTAATVANDASRPEAVRDPCLTSADPKCVEKNRAYYVPGRGYAPSVVRAARAADVSGSVGATGSGGAGGSLAVASPPARLSPRKASSYALPPGSESLADIARKP